MFDDPRADHYLLAIKIIFKYRKRIPEVQKAEVNLLENNIFCCK